MTHGFCGPLNWREKEDKDNKEKTKKTIKMSELKSSKYCQPKKPFRSKKV